MAEKKFLVDLNLTGNKAKNFRLEDYADNTAPTSNFVGRMIYTTTGTDRIEFYNGSSWTRLAHLDELTSGTVTSVGLSLDTAAGNVFGVSNSPITSTGSITLTLDTQSPNYVFAGPASGGSSAAPTFRALVAADIPSLSSTYQPLDGDLTAIAALSGTSGLLRKTAADTYTLDTATYLTTGTASSTYAPIDNPVFTGTVTVPTSIVFEGATADAFETTLTVVDPDQDRTITLPNASGTVALLGTIALGTDTTGNYVSQVSASTGISVDHTQGEGSTATISNTGVLSVTGTANEIEVSGTGTGPWTGAVTVGLPNNVQITGDLKVGGDLDIVGAINSFSTSTISVEDNKFLLNSNVTGVPSLDAGIEVERGDYTNASLYWNETANSWYVATPGDSGSAATSTALSLAGHTHSTSDITGIQEYIEDTVATAFTDSTSIDFTYTDNAGSAGTITAAVILATSNPYLSTTSGLAVDISALESKLTTDGYTKKYTTTIGDAAAQTFAVTHSLGTRAVTVSVYETASPYAEVEVEVLHTSTSVVTINTNNIPTSGQYTVVVVG